MLLCRLLIFFKIIILKKFSQKYHQNVKQFGPLVRLKDSSGLISVQNCLPRLSADDTGRQRVKCSNPEDQWTCICSPDTCYIFECFYTSIEPQDQGQTIIWYYLKMSTEITCYFAHLLQENLVPSQPSWSFDLDFQSKLSL